MATRDEVRTELVRSRGFIRGAETQLTKALVALDALDETSAPPTAGESFVFNPNEYPDTDALRPPGLRGEVNNYFTSARSGQLDGSIDLVPDPTFGKVVRLTFDDMSPFFGCGADEPTIAMYLNVPDLGREFWAEYDVRFDADWDVQFDCAGFAEHKLLLVQTSAGRRWDFMEGSGGSQFRAIPSGDTDRGLVLRDATGQPLNCRTYYDGQFHRYRFHYRMGANGAQRVWIDGQLMFSDVDFATNDGPGDTFDPVVKLGANMNLRPNRPVTWYIGGFRTWTSDPGW